MHRPPAQEFHPEAGYPLDAFYEAIMTKTVNPFEGIKPWRFEGIDVSVPGGDSTILKIADIENMSAIYLSMDEARHLRDWLVKSLPDEPEKQA